MRITKVIESRCWKHKTTGATASLYGSVPYTSDADKPNWEIVTHGFTWECADGRIGLGRKPAATREEAESVMREINARHAR